jgi:hypothetical protein
MITSNRMYKNPALAFWDALTAKSLNELLFVLRSLNELSLSKDLTHAQRRSIAHVEAMLLSKIQSELLAEYDKPSTEGAPF